MPSDTEDIVPHAHKHKGKYSQLLTVIKYHSNKKNIIYSLGDSKMNSRNTKTIKNFRNYSIFYLNLWFSAV